MKATHGVVRFFVMHVVVYCVIYSMHQRIQQLHYQKCNSNILQYYMLKDSQMCRGMLTLTNMLEKIVFVRLDTFIGHLHQVIHVI